MSDIFLYNGRVYTNDPDQPWVEAVHIRGHLIYAVGNTLRLQNEVKADSTVIDLRGRTVFPGFIDTHLHLTEWARRVTALNLEPFERLSDLLYYVKSNLPGNDWILGYGWNSNLWEEKRLPGAEDLEFINTRQKVIFFSKDWHTVWVNDNVIDLLDPMLLEKYTNDGRIDMNDLGQLTGIFREEAMSQLIAPLVENLQNPFYDNPGYFYETLFENGITSLHTMENYADYLKLRQLYQYQINRGPRLGFFIYHHDSSAIFDMSMHSGDGGQWFRFLGLKFFMDGTLGSQTALMQEPYDHKGMDDHGISYWQKEDLKEWVERAHKQEIAVAIHAIGDQAVDIVADVLNDASSVLIYPDRIEHAQLVDDDILKKLENSGIVITANPSHLLTDQYTGEKYWGKRCRQAYALADFQKHNIPAAFASDAPVESFNPWLGIMAAVTRQTRFSEIPWNAEQCINLDEAIRAYTSIPAYFSGEEAFKGKIQPGYFADLFIASQNPFEISPENWPDIRSVLTVIDGKIVYENQF